MVKNGLHVKIETIHRQVSPWSVSGPVLQHRRFEALRETLSNMQSSDVLRHVDWQTVNCILEELVCYVAQIGKWLVTFLMIWSFTSCRLLTG